MAFILFFTLCFLFNDQLFHSVMSLALNIPDVTETVEMSWKAFFVHHFCILTDLNNVFFFFVVVFV